MKRKGVGELEGVEEVHEKERTGLHGVDMWTKAFDHHTCSNCQATDLENYHWERKDIMGHHLILNCVYSAINLLINYEVTL